VLGVLILAGLAAGIVLANGTLALAVPVLLLGALLAMKRPPVAIGLTIAVSGMFGTITANLGSLPTQGSADVLLICLWIGVIGLYAIGNRRRAIRLWPGLLGVTVFVAISAVSMLLSTDVGVTFDSFRQLHWYMLIVPLVAFAPWPALTFERVAKGVVLGSLIIAAFSAFRYATGSSASEIAAARTVSTLPSSTELRFFGSFLSAQELGAWCAVVIPFATALALAWRGGWRWSAAALTALCAVDMLASHIRTGVAAGVLGLAVVLLLFIVARAFPSGRRVATGLIATAVVVVVGAGAIALTGAAKSTNESTSSISALLHPNEDRNYEIRKERWDVAWSSVTDEPFGHGLGTTGIVAQRHGALPIGPTPLDSSYLKVGIEQGIVGMVLYIAVLVILLASLCRYALTTLDRQRATFAIGAAGTLATMMILFYGSLYAEQPSVVVSGWMIVGLGCAGFTTSMRRTGRR
jgi:O-antigen ligase